MRISEFKLTAGDFATFGENLQRPECVWTDRDGVWVSDLRGGVSHIADNGSPELLGEGIAEPNGFSRRPNGEFVVADIGSGALNAIEPGGKTKTLLDRLDGEPLGAVNYACADGPDRIWLSVMTRGMPWHSALTTSKTDGYILRLDSDGSRREIVADGLDLTNEVKVSSDGQYLYAVETLGGRIVRFPIRGNGTLGYKERFGPKTLGRGALPDGITFDPWGNIWVTMITTNGLTVIDRYGDMHVVFRDANDAAVETLARGVEQRNGTVDHLAACTSSDGPLNLPTSVAFGGADGRTAFVGSVASPHLATFRLPDKLE